MTKGHMETGVGSERKSVNGRHSARRLAILLAMAVGATGLALVPPFAAADIVDPNVAGFAATPGYVNLNMTSSVDVTIGTSRGPGLDNYLVTVTKPDGSSTAAWYNFTAVGTISRMYGDAGTGFATRIDQPGRYDLRLDYYDGAAFTRAASAQVQATDELLVTLEAATASNEYTDVHNCPIAQEFQRGGEIIARAYVRYASTGDFVNGTLIPSAVGNVSGALLGEMKVLSWHNVYHFWRTAWFPAWNATVGPIVFTTDARDGRGNHGVASSPASGLTAWRIIPAILKAVPRIVNDTGVETVSFLRGDNLTVQARVTYESHNAHNRAFPGPLNATRGGQVTAVLGYGAYNASSGQFAQTLTTLSLSLDVASQNWTGTYRIPATDPVRPDLQVVVQASDGASPANTGIAFATRFAIQEPEAAPSPPPPAPSGLDPILAGGMAVVALLGGLGVGIAVARRGRKARGAGPGARPSKPEAGGAEEEWVVEDEKEGPQ